MVTMDYRGLQGLKGGYKGLQGVKTGYRGLWYGMGTLFIHGISFRYIYIQV